MPILNWNEKHVAAPRANITLTLDSILYPNGFGYPNSAPTGRLIHGDNFAVMSSLLTEYENRIALIYADPPFFTNRKFNARIGKGEDSRIPSSWRLAEGYHDNWASLDSYLQFLYERLALMYRLLTPNGSLYLHLDWHADSYARLILDELFGARGVFINEIIWTYHGPSPIRSAFNRKHDTILVYAKGADYTFNADAVREPYHPSTVQTFQSSRKAGFGKMPNLARGKVPEDWWYFPVVARLHNERSGYPTQKPEALLERIILASSNPDDLMADFFCGSGTTAVVAAKHGHKFIACDESFRAIQTARSRLAKTESICTAEHIAGSGARFLPAQPTAQARVRAGMVSLKTRQDIDFWEIDPNWDGKTFRSAAQAQRNSKTGDIALDLKANIGRHASIRWVTIQGKPFQLNI